MKKRKSDSDKPVKKAKKKPAKKELDNGISQKFLDAVAALGADTDRIARDIKKMSKQLTEKLADSIKQIKKENQKSAKKRNKKDEPEIKGKKFSAKAEKVAALVRAKEKDVVSKSNTVSAVNPSTRTAANATKPVVRRTRKKQESVVSGAESSAPAARGRRRTQGTDASAPSKPVVRRTRRTNAAPKANEVVHDQSTSGDSDTESQK